MEAVIENALVPEKRRQGMMSQVNARIETETKRAADAAFAGAGIAPSEAIRALYGRAAALGSSLKSVGDLVVDGGKDAEAQSSREATFERATHAFENVLANYGLVVDVQSFAPMTEEEIEAARYQDYLAGGAP
ncbi:MAG: hypothetical protein IJ092_02110 [Atopobiaceae bacterium]|nr:hypothetical protein [Atopobiaceae bacterium]